MATLLQSVTAIHLLVLLCLSANVESAALMSQQDPAVLESAIVHDQAKLRYKHATDQYQRSFAALKKFRAFEGVTPRVEAALEPVQECPAKECQCNREENTFYISCRYTNLKAIPEFAVFNIVYEKIDFGIGNNIETLHYNAFKNLQVRQIDLENNNIHTVADGAFLGLGKVLNKLSLQGNGTVPIPYIQLSGLLNLQELSLKDFNASTIPANNVLGNFEKLEILKMNNINGLKSIDSTAFANKLPKLNKLVLENVPVTLLPVAALQQLKNLSTLVIQHSFIDNIFAKSFTHENFHTLRDLTLSNNKIKLIEMDAFEKVCETLENLDLMDNYVADVSFLRTKFWKNLLSLNLSYNYKLGSTNIAGAFHNMPNLKHLYLDNINLQTIPKGFFTGLTSLKNLKLSYNRIMHIEDGVFLHTPKLLEIQLESQFEGEENQTEPLVLSPNTFAGIATVLESLKLDKSPLNAEAFWNTIKSLTQLHTIFIKGLKLHNIPDNAFVHNTKLEVIDLGENGISILPDSAFLGLRSSLQEIGLQSNNLTTISQCVFKDFIKLQSIYLAENPLQCDCELSWLHDFINREHNSIHATIVNKMSTCKTPVKFIGKPLHTISAEDLTCSVPPRKPCHYVTETTTKPTSLQPTNATPTETTKAQTTLLSSSTKSQSQASLVLYIGRVTETSITVSWLVYGVFVPIKGYRLVYKSIIENKNVSILRPPETNGHLIDNLNPGSSYEICVKIEFFSNDQNSIKDCHTGRTLSEKPDTGVKTEEGNNTIIITLVTVVIVVVLLIAGLYMFVKYKIQKLKEIRLTMESVARGRNPSWDYCEHEDRSSCTVPNEYTDIRNTKLAEQYKIYSTKQMQRQFAVDTSCPERAYSTYSKVKHKKQRKPRDGQKQENKSSKEEVDSCEVDDQLKTDLEQRHSAPSRLDAHELLKSSGSRSSRPLPATPDKLYASPKSGDPMAQANTVFMTQVSVYDDNRIKHQAEPDKEKQEGIYHEIGATDTLPRK